MALSREEEPSGIFQEHTDPNDKLFLSGQGQVDDGAKESPSKFFELLAGKERNRRLLQLEGVEKGTNTEQSLC